MEKPITQSRQRPCGTRVSTIGPANVRELENTMERAVALESGSEISLPVLPRFVLPDTPALAQPPSPVAVETYPPKGSISRRKCHAERRYLQAALEKADGVRNSRGRDTQDHLSLVPALCQEA